MAKHYHVVEDNVVTGYVVTAGAVDDPRYVEIDPAQINGDAMVGKAYDGGQYNDIPPPPVRVISLVDFLDRFTDTELGKIETLAQTNDRARGWLRWLNAQGAIDLDRNRVASTVQLMEQHNVIDSGRASEILA